METTVDQAYLELAASVGMNFPPDTFAFVVNGQCMNAGAIDDSDLVFIRPLPPKQGDVVAFTIGTCSPLLKRYHVENGTALLRADSPNYPEIPVTEEISFLGVMVGLIRGAYQRAEHSINSSVNQSA